MQAATVIATRRLSVRHLTMALLLALASLVLTPQPAVAEEGSPYRFEIPGRLIDVGGYRLHIYCRGEGQPVVMMDAGLGGSSYEWLDIQSSLAEHVRACVYDRAGYGWSELAPGPRSSGHIAEELLILLTNANIPAPYVLVGHSFGGYNVQLFARRNPELTAGLVLVDSSHSEQVDRYLAPPIRVKLAPEVNKERRTRVHLARPKLHPKLPARLKGIVMAMLSHGMARRAIAEEYVNFRLSAREVKSAPPMPDVPLFVISRGQRVWPEDEKGDRMEELWLELQTELALQSPRHAHIIASESGHHVHLDQPQLVLGAIRNVIDAASLKKDPAPSYYAGKVPLRLVFKRARLASYTFN